MSVTILNTPQTIHGLYQVLQGKRSQSSGRGGSYWANSASCGMKGRLNELFPFDDDEEDYDPSAALTPTGLKKVNGRRAGVFYHDLQALWRTGQLPEGTVVSAEHEDQDFAAALNAFRSYRTRFDDVHNRGRVIEAEVKYPSSPEQASRIRAVLGGELDFTIRPDLVVQVGPSEHERIIRDAQLYARPGRWLVDHKLLKDVGAAAVEYNTNSFQARSYAAVYNICNPETPVLGTMFDMTARVKKPEDRHFVLALAELQVGDLQLVRDAVAGAAENFAGGEAQAMNCFGRFGACRFLKRCPRRGTFADFEFDAHGGWKEKVK